MDAVVTSKERKIVILLRYLVEMMPILAFLFLSSSNTFMTSGNRRVFIFIYWSASWVYSFLHCASVSVLFSPVSISKDSSRVFPMVRFISSSELLLKPCCSSTRSPSMVLPPGEQTASFSAPGCLSPARNISAEPTKVMAAYSMALARGMPQATAPSDNASSSTYT